MNAASVTTVHVYHQRKFFEDPDGHRSPAGMVSCRVPRPLRDCSAWRPTRLPAFWTLGVDRLTGEAFSFANAVIRILSSIQPQDHTCTQLLGSNSSPTWEDSTSRCSRCVYIYTT
jgi:hypothetical protein